MLLVCVTSAIDLPSGLALPDLVASFGSREEGQERLLEIETVFSLSPWEVIMCQRTREISSFPSSPGGDRRK